MSAITAAKSIAVRYSDNRLAQTVIGLAVFVATALVCGFLSMFLDAELSSNITIIAVVVTTSITVIFLSMFTPETSPKK